MSRCRHVVMTSCRGLQAACPCAVWVGAAAPEFFARVDAFLCHTLDHWLAADGAGGSVVRDALLLAVCQSLCCKAFGKAAFFSELLQLSFHLSVQHQYKTSAEYQKAVGCLYVIVGVKPGIELMFLFQYVNAAFMQYIVFIFRAVQLYATYCFVFRIVYGPGYAFLA